MMQVDLPGRVAFIIGAAGGIGSAMAQAFSANGAAVAVVDINFSPTPRTAMSAATC